MIRKSLMGALLIAAMGVVPMVAQDQGPGGRGGPGRGRGPGGPGGPGGPNILGMVRQLDLSEQQREQVRALMEEQRQSEPGAAVREAEQKLHAALLADTPDVAAIDALKSTLNAAHAAELDRQVALMLKVAQILTPAQREQLQNFAPPAGRRGR